MMVPRSHKEPTESYQNFAECLADQLGRWEKSAEVGLREIVLLEQFLTALLRELALKSEKGKARVNQAGCGSC